MGDTERRLLLAIYRSNPEVTFVRDICQVIGNYQQNLSYLKQWGECGWWWYSETPEDGFLTFRGKEIAENLDRLGILKEKTPTVGSD
jgi:hypothetical protein